MIFSLLLALVVGIVGFIINTQIVRIVMIVLLSIFLILALVFAILLVKKIKVVDADLRNINKSLDKVSTGKPEIISTSSDNQDIKDIAYKVNELSITNVSIKRSTIYEADNFLEEVSKLVNNGFIDDYVYVRFFNLKKKALTKLKKENNNIYIARNGNNYDIVFPLPEDRSDFEDYIRDYSVIYASKILIFYSIDYKKEEIKELLEKDENENGIYIYHRKDGIDSFNKDIDKYRHIELSTDKLLIQYLKDMMKYLPYSHMGILRDDDYVLTSTYESKRQIIQLKISDFPYHEIKDLFTYKGHKYALVLVAEDEVFLVKDQRRRLEIFVELLKDILLAQLSRNSDKEVEARFNRIEYLSDSLSYEVDGNFTVIHASDKLEMRHNNSLMGSKCYKGLYGRNKPCPDCPLLDKDQNHKDTYILGTKRYRREITFNGENKSNIIYLVNKPESYVSTKEHLYDRLLGLINKTDSRGYLLCFKLDGLTALADRNKTPVDEVVKEIIKILRIYGLDDHLYRKDVDEFVYVLEDASVADAVTISKLVSKAFYEKFETQNKEVSFTPKMILLSYPLEVNTLFSLDSLCRTMFANISKKGSLYRVDEEATPIDNNRYYMEIVEDSYKKNNIPFSYSEVLDRKENKKIEYAYINYIDNEGKPIREDEITLYCKINNTYLTLVERVTKALVDSEETNPNQVYILPIGKEALVPALFASIIGYMNSKKVKLDKIIFEVKEKDAYNHIDEITKIASNGINMAMVSKDNNIYDMDISFYRYIKLDGLKLSKDPLYQSKVNKMISLGLNMMIDEDGLALLPEARYTFTK